MGIDVVGTNTDSVLIDGHPVVTSAKRTTTEEVSARITATLEGLLGTHIFLCHSGYEFDGRIVFSTLPGRA